jgi:hypothetical protein
VRGGEFYCSVWSRTGWLLMDNVPMFIHAPLAARLETFFALRVDVCVWGKGVCCSVWGGGCLLIDHKPS